MLGGMGVHTTLDNDCEELGQSTNHYGQEDISTDFEGQKKDDTEENNLAGQQGNQVRYIDKSGKATQSEENPQHCLEGKDQDKASASLHISEHQAEEDEKEMCVLQKNSVELKLVTQPCEEQKDLGPSGPYKDKSTKPPSARTVAKGRSITDTTKKNIPISDHDMRDQYLGADDLAAGGPTKHKELMTSCTQEVTGKEKTSTMPNKNMKKLCEESIGGTNQHKGLEEKTEENSTSRVPAGGPNRHYEKAEVPSTYDNLNEKKMQATTEPQMINKKADKKVGKLKKHPNQDGKTQFGFKWLRGIILFFVVSLAQCHTTRASMESTVISNSELQTKPVTDRDGEWNVYWFCVEEELYGKSLSFKIGQEICELQADHSPCNVTCDRKSEAFLVTNNCTALITRCTNKNLHLEWGDLISTRPKDHKIFSSLDKAMEHVQSKVPPNPKDESRGTSSAPDCHVWIGIAVVGLLGTVPGIAFCICWLKKRCQSSGMNTKVTNGTPNGSNERTAQDDGVL